MPTIHLDLTPQQARTHRFALAYLAANLADGDVEQMARDARASDSPDAAERLAGAAVAALQAAGEDPGPYD